MFDLDTAIGKWRRQLGGSADVLDELEGHLRDDIDQQVKSGSNLEEVFQIAVQRFGSATCVQEEFKKNTRMNPPKDKVTRIVGALGFGSFAVLSTVALFSNVISATTNERLLGLGAIATSGFLLFVGQHIWRIMPAIADKKTRYSVAIACAAFYALITASLFHYVLPRLDFDGADCCCDPLVPATVVGRGRSFRRPDRSG